MQQHRLSSRVVIAIKLDVADRLRVSDNDRLKAEIVSDIDGTDEIRVSNWLEVQNLISSALTDQASQDRGGQRADGKG